MFCIFIIFVPKSTFLMVHLYLCLPDRCGHKIRKSKGDRQCKIGQKETVFLFCSYVFSVRTGQANRCINAPLMETSQMLNHFHKRDFLGYALDFCLKFMFLSIEKIKCYTRYTKDILVGYLFHFHLETYFHG